MSHKWYNPKTVYVFSPWINNIYSMVLNTITHNMEKLIMKRRAIFHNDTNIKNALLLFGQGWTTRKIAKKMNVSDATVYNWKKKYPEYAVRKVTTTLSKNGITTSNTIIKPVVTKSTLDHKLTISLGDQHHGKLVELADYEVRTLSDQVKYLVLKELERIDRNRRNIPL
jgi:DNA-binding CsgD family transcriptional regulator